MGLDLLAGIGFVVKTNHTTRLGPDPYFIHVCGTALHEYPELGDTVRTAFFRIIERLGGTPPVPEVPSSAAARSQIDTGTASSLAGQLLEIAKLEPQPRGYAFEKFLNAVFEAYGLSPRAPFRLTGEQIDGSFVAGGDVYLLEAKWTNRLVGVATLRSFNAKVEDKAR